MKQNSSVLQGDDVMYQGTGRAARKKDDFSGIGIAEVVHLAGQDPGPTGYEHRRAEKE
jgi:hypothetical protein